MNIGLERATTEELNELLRMAMSADASELNVSLVKRVMDELEKRGDLQEISDSAARHSFEQCCERIRQLQGERTVSTADRGSRRIAGRTVAIALALAVILATGIISSAARFDFFGAVAKWTQDVFQALTGKDEKAPYDLSPYDTLTYRLAELGVDVALPTWMPEEFTSGDIEEWDGEAFSHIVAWYANEEGSSHFSLMVESIGQSNNASQGEKGMENAEVYMKGGIEHFVMGNHERYQATWADGDYEIVVQGDLTYEQIIKIIDSIYEGVTK